MTPLDKLRLCAEAMGYTLTSDWNLYTEEPDTVLCVVPQSAAHVRKYRPLHNDAQAMALVKKMHMRISPGSIEPMQYIWHVETNNHTRARSENLNEAIVECAARAMQGRKG